MNDPTSIKMIGPYFKLINDALERKLNQQLEMFHLTSSQLGVLTYLMFRGDEKATIRDIQLHLNIAHPTAAGLVKRLEEKDYVRTYTDPKDKRARIVVLNPLTRTMLNENVKPASHIEEELQNGMTANERELLSDLLLRVYKNIK